MVSQNKGQWRLSYNKETQTLTVTFPSGASYDYDAVPPDIAEGFERAESKGSYFNANIRGIY